MSDLKSKRHTHFVLAALWAASISLAGGAQGQVPDPSKAAVPVAKPADNNVKQPPAPKPADIDRAGILVLVRTTLLALDQANKTGNYTVLRDIGAPGFQSSNNAARLGDLFASQRRDNLDLSGVAALDPQITLAPQIEDNGMMHLAGFFPSVSTQVRFEMLFAPIAGQWKLFGLSVSLDKAGPSAPQSTPVAPDMNAKP